MMLDLHNAVQRIRYWLFPESKRIDDRTRKIDRERQVLKRQKAQTDEIIKHANQADVLRHMVINMTKRSSN
jgi:hypothetical protein